MMKHSSATRSQGFTLIELLVVIAIIAILAAILFPVFARAKTAAKVATSISGVKQLSLALHMYSTDYDDMSVPNYGYATPAEPSLYLNRNTWVGRTYPYVKNRGIYFDTLKGEPRGDDFADPFYPGLVYKWEWVTTFSINIDGYTESYGGTDCLNINWGATPAPRSLTAFEDPAQRLAITSTRYANLSFSWMRFYATDGASWPTADRYASGFDWYQLVWDARREYPGPKFVGGYTDGHAAKFGKEKFVGYYVDTPSQTEASSYSQYCAVMDSRKLWTFWGRAWSGD